MTFESSTVNKIDLGKAVVKYSKLALEKALNYLKSSTIKIIHINYLLFLIKKVMMFRWYMFQM
jgi:hypothetical protein